MGIIISDENRLLQELYAKMTQITDSYMVTHQVLYWGDVEEAIEKYFINKRAEQTEPTQEWIPCSERLPDDDTLILFCATYDNKTNISISKGNLVRDWWKAVEEAAWMPLPEPYRADRKE